MFNPLNAELNPICHLLAFVGAHHILHTGRIRVKIKKKKLLWHIEELIVPENAACFELSPNQNFSAVNVNYKWHLTCIVNSTSDSIQYVVHLRDGQYTCSSDSAAGRCGSFCEEVCGQ
jgi:hypothetical protein